jgi:transcriptional regulator with XRE-family HTH domain
MARGRKQQRASRSFRDELPVLLEQRGVSHRQLAASIDLPQSYLSLVINGKRAPSQKLLERSARFLGLADDYFPEYREHVAVDAIKRDGRLRDRVYDSL